MKKKSLAPVSGQRFEPESPLSSPCKATLIQDSPQVSILTRNRAYIISVNASILSDTGGTCICKDPTDITCTSSNQFATDYALCVQEVNRDLITATAVIAGLSTVLFGLFTNMPVALAPGMGLNAYFAYQVVGFHGTGRITYGQALAAVFIEGFIFLFLSLIGMRQWLVRLLPTSIKVASGCGIGLFLSLIGLSYSAGIGAVTGGGTATPMALAGCPPQYINTETGACDSHLMQNPTVSYVTSLDIKFSLL
jgi:AGZA family xanthine/uracil permease-like MFS transporter